MKMKNEHETCVTSRLTLESVPSPIGKKQPRRLFNCKISPAKVGIYGLRVVCCVIRGVDENIIDKIEHGKRS